MGLCRNIECWLSDRGGDDLLLAIGSGDGVDLPLRDKGPVTVSCMNILLLVHIFVTLSVIDSRVAYCAPLSSSLNLQAVYVIF